jgi:cell division protein FtsL
MRKFFVISLIIFLVLFTAIIKNSTKRIDDKIFTIKENIRGLKKDFENVKLEHDYLSSAEKLLEFQKMYFEDELIKKDIRNIKIIDQTIDNFKIEQFKFTDEQ